MQPVAAAMQRTAAPFLTARVVFLVPQPPRRPSRQGLLVRKQPRRWSLPRCKPSRGRNQLRLPWTRSRSAEADTHPHQIVVLGPTSRGLDNVHVFQTESPLWAKPQNQPAADFWPLYLARYSPFVYVYPVMSSPSTLNASKETDSAQHKASGHLCVIMLALYARTRGARLR
jgi:hypothetical protein